MATTSTNTALPFPPLPAPTNRDIDNFNTAIKQIMSAPTMALNTLLDAGAQAAKTMQAQVQNMVQNIPKPPMVTMPVATAPTTMAAQINPIQTAGKISPSGKTEFERYVEQAEADI